MSSNTLQEQMCLDDFQEQVADWVDDQPFGAIHPGWHSILGIQEEVGELSHAYLKREQGIRGTEEEHGEAIFDAIGDIMVYLADFCSTQGIQLQNAMEQTWNKVKNRDWNKNPENGVSPLDQEIEAPEPKEEPKTEFDRSLEKLVQTFERQGFKNIRSVIINLRKQSEKEEKELKAYLKSLPGCDDPDCPACSFVNS